MGLVIVTVLVPAAVSQLRACAWGARQLLLLFGFVILAVLRFQFLEPFALCFLAGVILAVFGSWRASRRACLLLTLVILVIRFHVVCRVAYSPWRLHLIEINLNRLIYQCWTGFHFHTTKLVTKLINMIVATAIIASVVDVHVPVLGWCVFLTCQHKVCNERDDAQEKAD